MESPAFSLSLNDFPGLFDVPSPSEAFLGETVIDRLVVEASSLEPRTPAHLLWPWLNEARHYFWSIGDERSSMAFVDLTFAFQNNLKSSWNAYTLSVLTNWATEPESIVRALLDKAATFRQFPSLHAVCLKRSHELCQQAGVQDAARRLFELMQKMGKPNYFELAPIADRIKLPRYLGVVAPSSVQTPLPEPVEGAHNGWREGRWNPLSPQQEEEVRLLIAKHDLQETQEQIISLSQNAIGFQRLGRLPHRVGASRLGGVPDVLDSWVWPKDMEFLAQFNLEKIAPFDFNHVLPSHGMLRFFAEDVWEWEGDSELLRVEWDETDLTELKHAPYPADYEIEGLDKCDGNRLMVFEPVSLAPFSYITIPSGYDVLSRYTELIDGEESDGITNSIDAIQRDCAQDTNETLQLLGRNDTQQEAAWKTKSPTSFDKLTAEEKPAAAQQMEQWLQLLVLKSYVGHSTRSDCGAMYFFIHRDDLMARRFNQTQLEWFNS